MKLHKTAILNDIRFHYKFKNNVDFAKFLGITPQNLSNWYKRNHFDIERVYAKCEGINPTWLLTGKGPMFSDSSTKEIENASIENLKNLLASKDKIIALYEQKIKTESDKEDKLAAISAQNQLIIEYLESQDIEKIIKKAKGNATKKMKKTRKF